MKKNLLPIAVLSILLGIMLFSSCKKSDTTPPVINILGANPYTVYLNSTYVDPGATASDNKDGDLTASIVSDASSTNPDMNRAGTYYIHYSVSDAAANITTSARTVYVLNSEYGMAGEYSVSDDTTGQPAPLAYVDTIIASDTVNNRIYVTKFAGYNDCYVYFNISGTNVTFPLQNVTQIGSPPHNHTFNGTGSISGTTITINYTDVFDSLRTVQGTEVYTRFSKKK